jgi:hypothetical protein
VQMMGDAFLMQWLADLAYESLTGKRLPWVVRRLQHLTPDNPIIISFPMGATTSPLADYCSPNMPCSCSSIAVPSPLPGSRDQSPQAHLRPIVRPPLHLPESATPPGLDKHMR